MKRATRLDTRVSLEEQVANLRNQSKGAEYSTMQKL